MSPFGQISKFIEKMSEFIKKILEEISQKFYPLPLEPEHAHLRESLRLLPTSEVKPSSHINKDQNQKETQNLTDIDKELDNIMIRERADISKQETVNKTPYTPSEITKERTAISKQQEPDQTRDNREIIDRS